jgi:16S rRNA (adenine1518-N6/adenine1519-N6)-dimethyltransferase
VIQEQLFESLPYDVDENIFRTVVRTAFGKRRKTLRNSLKYLPWDELVNDARLPPSLLDKRPEQLTVEQFVDLTNLLSQYSQELSHGTS